MGEPIGVGLPETGDLHGAFPRLTEEQLAILRAAGDRARGRARRGAVPRRATPATTSSPSRRARWPSSTRTAPTNRVIAVHGPQRFLGELNLLTGSAVYLTAVVTRAGR